MSQRRVLFGASLGQWNGADVGNVPGVLEIAAAADRGGLDMFTIADHLYFGDKLDAYSAVGFLLGRTSTISGAVIVTNLPSFSEFEFSGLKSEEKPPSFSPQTRRRRF